MEEEAPKYMSMADYARRRGVSKAAMTQALAYGRISVVLVDGQRVVDVKESDRLWAERTDTSKTRADKSAYDPHKYKRGQPREGEEEQAQEASVADFSRARALRESIDVKLKGLKLKTQMGLLVPADEYAKIAFDDGRKIRNAMQAIPDRIAPILAAETDVTKLHNILLSEINRTLEGLVRELGGATEDSISQSS